MPDPRAEKSKVLEIYNPACHQYTPEDPPVWSEAEPGHYVLASGRELEEYRRRLGC